MKLTVTLEVENGEHPALQNREIKLRYRKFGTQDFVDVPTKSDAKKQLAWELDGVLESDGSDDSIFVFSVTFYGRAGGKPILQVYEGLFWKKGDAGLECVEYAPETGPRAFKEGHPLFSFVGRAKAGEATVQATVHTTYVDLTEHVLDLEETHPDVFKVGTSWNEMSLHALRAQDFEGTELRLVGVLDDSKERATCYAVLLPKDQVRKPDRGLGGFFFYGPAHKNPPLFGDGSDLADRLRDNYLDGVSRIVRPRALSTGASYAGDTPANQLRPSFGQTTDDGAGYWPNCILAALVARVKKPFVAVIAFQFYPRPTKAFFEGLVRFLYGTNVAGQDLWEKPLALGRLALAGYSGGGPPAINAIGADFSEVYLIDAVIISSNSADPNAPVRWFKADPEHRYLRLISGSFLDSQVKSWPLLNGIRLSVQSSVKTVTGQDGASRSNFSFFPEAMFDKRPSDGREYGKDYYDPKPDVGHPEWMKGFEWFRQQPFDPSDPKKGLWKDQGYYPQLASAQGLAHQWVAFAANTAGGTKNTDPFGTAYRTFLGECLDLADF